MASWAVARSANRGPSSCANVTQSVRCPPLIGCERATAIGIPPRVRSVRRCLAREPSCPAVHNDRPERTRQAHKMDLQPCPPTSRVGSTMKGYGQFCPVAVACEVFAERWTPLILREMFCGSTRFNDLRRGMPLISRTLLAQRLQALEESGVIESIPLVSGRGREYRLTQAGEEFRAVIDRLGQRCQRGLHGKGTPENREPGLLQ